MRSGAAWAAIAALVVASRLCHVELLWVEEAYGAAAAAQMTAGKILYRDVWFDKPPLYALAYYAIGAQTGVVLRLAGSAYVLLACWCAYLFARERFGKKEGLIAAALLAFFLTFAIPSAVIALAPDLLMIPLHIAAMLFAARGRPVLSGVLAGCSTLANSKGLFVLLACLMWAPGAFARTLAGFAAVAAGTAGVLAWSGALGDHWQQVWVWGARYSADTFVSNPIGEMLKRTVNWAGFHLALLIGAFVYVARERSWRLWSWVAISFAAVCAGFRFFPRYYFQLLPPLTFAAARGLVIAPRRLRAAALIALVIPAMRFGPRYIDLARGGAGDWPDTALMRDSRAVSALLGPERTGATLLVWGYRPEVFLYSGLPAGTRYLDSQPLTGVLADRHLVDATPTFPAEAARARAELARTSPTYIVDGLGPLNPRLAITAYPDLRGWLSQYEPVGRTPMSIVYRLRSPDRMALR